MRILILNNEAQYFGGAEKMLGYFLEGLLEEPGCEAVAALVRGSRLEKVIPEAVPKIYISSNQKFSPTGLLRQVRELAAGQREFRCNLIHAWQARSWELASLSGRQLRVPVLGTLHDDPEASFISPLRQKIMRWCGRWGLNQIACVSGAVSLRCQSSGYPEKKLRVVHNGLPILDKSVPSKAFSGGPVRLGFIGVFSERKGVRGLFEIVDKLVSLTDRPWVLYVAGGAQDAAGEQIAAEIRKEFSNRPWWPRVQWIGWTERPLEFMAGLDLLVCPSRDFDPFPTVLLEAGQVGVPVLAARVGGVAEIVEEGTTGWLFESGQWGAAAERLAGLLEAPDELVAAGRAAAGRIRTEFAVRKMVAQYLNLYSNLAGNV